MMNNEEQADVREQHTDGARVAVMSVCQDQASVQTQKPATGKAPLAAYTSNSKIKSIYRLVVVPSSMLLQLE